LGEEGNELRFAREGILGVKRKIRGRLRATRSTVVKLSEGKKELGESLPIIQVGGTGEGAQLSQNTTIRGGIGGKGRGKSKFLVPDPADAQRRGVCQRDTGARLTLEPTRE